MRWWCWRSAPHYSVSRSPAFLPVFVQTIFHKGPETYTLLLVFSGAGSICGALIVAAMEKFKGQQRLTVLILAFLGFAIAGLCSFQVASTLLPAYLSQGVAVMASASLMVSLVQLIATDAMRGRVMSVYNLAFRAGIPLGSLALGKLIPIFGVGYILIRCRIHARRRLSLFPAGQGTAQLRAGPYAKRECGRPKETAGPSTPLRSGRDDNSFSASNRSTLVIPTGA